MGTHPAVVVVLTVVDLVGMTRFERRLGRHGHVAARSPLWSQVAGVINGNYAKRPRIWSDAKLVGHFQSEMGIRSTTFLLGVRHR
jgi:hypothetical protein